MECRGEGPAAASGEATLGDRPTAAAVLRLIAMLPVTEDDSQHAHRRATPPRPGVIVVHAGAKPAFRPFALPEGDPQVLVGRAGPLGPTTVDDGRLSREHARIASGVSV